MGDYTPRVSRNGTSLNGVSYCTVHNVLSSSQYPTTRFLFTGRLTIRKYLGFFVTQLSGHQQQLTRWSGNDATPQTASAALHVPLQIIFAGLSMPLYSPMHTSKLDWG